MSSVEKRCVVLVLAILSFYLHPLAAQETTSEPGPPEICGGPKFPCSLRQTNAQLTVIPLPNPIPDMGNLTGAGKSWNAPAYGNTIVRCTDINSDPGNTEYYSYEVTDTGGSNDQVWNANGTLLRIMDADTGSSRIYGFDSSTGQCTTANQYSKAPTGAAWSPTNPNVDYTLNGTVVVRRTFDYTQPLKAPTSVTVFDAHWCPGLSTLKPTWSAPLTVNADSSTFVTAFSDRGGQDTGEYVVAFDRALGCQVWNTLTGTVTAKDLGEGGRISTFYPLTVHNVSEGPGGVAVIAVGSTCKGCPKHSGPFLWKAGTLTAYLLETAVGGHETIGYSHYLNLVNSPAVDSRIWDVPGKVTPVTSADGVDFPASVSTHLAWGNVDPADSYPFSATSIMPLSEPFTIKGPLEQELWGADPATGTFLRLAPTMTSGRGNVFNFRTQYAIESMSPTGCIAWSSDWMGTLGNTDGNTASCKLGSNPPMACRSDVFVTCPR